jgi:hypothetical protein
MLKDVMTEDKGKRRKVERSRLPNIVRLKKSRSIRRDEHFARIGDVLVMCLIALSVGWYAMEGMVTDSLLGKNLWCLNIQRRLTEIIL